MLKLFLLGGFRGIVANVLWTRAEEHKRDHDWDRLKATVDLITKLQPHFLSVWTFQGWNLAYNVSVEWDAPEDKYEWIKKGIKFLQDGVEQEPQVARPDLGHRLDLLPQARLRRRGDHPPPALPRRRGRGVQDLPRPRDAASRRRQATTTSSSATAGSAARSTWSTRAPARLAGGTAATAIEYVDPSPQRKGRPDDIAFRSMPAHAQTRYAAGLEKMSILGIPATFGEVAKNEWARALNEWVKFGKHDVRVAQRDPTRRQARSATPIQIDDAHRPREVRRRSTTTRSTGPTAGPTR